MRANDITLDVFDEVAQKWLQHLGGNPQRRLSNGDQKMLCRMVLFLSKDVRAALAVQPAASEAAR